MLEFIALFSHSFRDVELKFWEIMDRQLENKSSQSIETTFNLMEFQQFVA